MKVVKAHKKEKNVRLDEPKRNHSILKPPLENPERFPHGFIGEIEMSAFCPAISKISEAVRKSG